MALSMGCLFGGAAAGGKTAAEAAGCGRVSPVPRETLYVSEPPPTMFGNGPNPAPSKGQGWSNGNWLKSRFHFSFAEYSGGRDNFGVLRVMNDDLVQPSRGFGAHPHRDMEIITFVVEGRLTHKDSLGTEETLGRGSVQFMTAGTGVRHSEHNLEKATPLRFIQSWVVPRRRGLPPNYGSMLGDEAAAEARKDTWAHLVSDVQDRFPTPVKINQDCNVFVAELGPSVRSPALELRGGRQAYMLCVEGDLALGESTRLRQHDAAELYAPMDVEVIAGEAGCLALVFEMAASGGGRDDL